MIILRMNVHDIYIQTKMAFEHRNIEKAIECAEKLAIDGYLVGYAYLTKLQPRNKILWKLSDEPLKHIEDVPSEQYNSWLDEYIANKARYDSEHLSEKKKIWIIQRVSDIKFRQIKMPYNFSWACDMIYGSGLPTYPEQIEVMRDVYGIKHIITIRETKLAFDVPDVHFHHFPVPDMFPPSDEQLDTIVSIMQRSEPCIVHCHGGIGRTGLALIAYILKSNFDAGKPMLVSDAIAIIVKRRPWTRLTEHQDIFIRKWNDKLSL